MAPDLDHGHRVPARPARRVGRDLGRADGDPDLPEEPPPGQGWLHRFGNRAPGGLAVSTGTSSDSRDLAMTPIANGSGDSGDLRCDALVFFGASGDLAY